jgi:hypothetical protein
MVGSQNENVVQFAPLNNYVSSRHRTIWHPEATDKLWLGHEVNDDLRNLCMCWLPANQRLIAANANMSGFFIEILSLSFLRPRSGSWLKVGQDSAILISREF